MGRRVKIPGWACSLGGLERSRSLGFRIVARQVRADAMDFLQEPAFDALA